MNFTTIILNILLLSVSLNACLLNKKNKDCLDIKLKNVLYSKQPIDTIKQKNDNFYVLIRGSQNYDIIITTIEKEDYEEAKQLKPAKLLNSAVIPTQVNITENCYTVTTSIETVRNCLEDDEQLISISYLGFIEKLNSCVLYENWFESTISNLLINLDDGSTSYISGYELIFSPNLKFIYSYANDGIDFDGISLHQMIDKKAHPILVTDYDMEEKYKFNFSSFGKAYWVSDTSFYASNGDAYYKFEIQDKRITYRNEFQENSIHSENSKFTIKIDKLKDGTLRYMSWNKPNTTSDRPSLVLYNGAIEQQNKYGLGYDYRFENGEYLYLIENNISTTSSKRVILKLYIDNEEKLNSTMKDLTILK